MSDDADIRSGRLDSEQVAQNFSDLHPPLKRSQALLEADRCYFCYDAPCTTACPTGIDIPSFIQKIRSDNIRGSAKTIFDENIMGGMCARVCPTEVLCEQACVRNTHEDKPVEIGLLQRYATDPVIEAGDQLYTRAESSGKKVVVVGAGPAGLACAHRLSMLGHSVTILGRDEKAGGLNEYGIAAYKTPDNFAQTEVDYILGIGGIELINGKTLGDDVSLDELCDDYDAVFLGIGLGDVNSLGIDNDELAGVEDAVTYIAKLRQAEDKSTLPVGRRVVVIGGGMTAIDVAVQSKRLGAESVDVVYRRGPEQMGASDYEQELAQTNGVQIRYWAQPVKILGNGHAQGVRFEHAELDDDGKLVTTGMQFDVDADIVFKAIGQALHAVGLDKLDSDHGRIAVDENFQTSREGVYAGGDCVAGGEDLTVSAVQHGKLAAHSIDKWLRA